MSSQLGRIHLTRMPLRYAGENGHSENVAGGRFGYLHLPSDRAEKKRSNSRCVPDSTRDWGVPKKKQEEYRFPDGAVLEADEAAMKTWKTETPRGRVRWAADV